MLFYESYCAKVILSSPKFSAAFRYDRPSPKTCFATLSRTSGVDKMLLLVFLIYLVGILLLDNWTSKGN